MGNAKTAGCLPFRAPGIRVPPSKEKPNEFTLQPHGPSQKVQVARDYDGQWGSPFVILGKPNAYEGDAVTIVKRFAGVIDRTVLSGFGFRLLRAHKKKAHLSEALSGFRYISYSGLDKTVSRQLDSLSEKYGSDKGGRAIDGRPFSWPPHTYTQFYARHFNHCRDSVRFVFECGLGTNNPALISSMGDTGKPGASLRMWRDYFPNAQIFGVDIDPDTLFSDERIVTMQMDQTDPESIEKFWEETPDVLFDFMVDDGLHTFEAGLTLFRHSQHRLHPDGIWVIEDVGAEDAKKFADHIRSPDWQVDVVCMERPRLNFWNNNLVVIRRSSVEEIN